MRARWSAFASASAASGSTTRRSAASQSATSPAIARLARQIAGLLRVGVEIEQLRRHAGVIDVFERALADHEGAGRRAGGVVFAEDRAPRRRAARDVEQRGAGQVAVVGMRRKPDAGDDGRETSTSDTGSRQTKPCGTSGPARIIGTPADSSYIVDLPHSRACRDCRRGRSNRARASCRRGRSPRARAAACRHCRRQS